MGLARALVSRSARLALLTAALSGLGVRPAGFIARSESSAVGVIVGNVVMEGTGEPLGHGVVSIESLNREQTTDANGRFVFTDVPAGQATVRAKHVGFAPTDLAVTVPASDTVRFRLVLARLAVELPPTTITECRKPWSPPGGSSMAANALDSAAHADEGGSADAQSTAVSVNDASRVQGTARKVAPRVFTVFPAIAGKTTWDLGTDGALNLGAEGSWTITPRSTFQATTMMWGGGGGAAFKVGGAGGGGGYSTSSITFQAGVVYTIIVGGGGRGAPNAACGGEGGFGGGGAGGGVQPPGAGDAGTPFFIGGRARLGVWEGGGSAGGGGGLSGLFLGTAPSQPSALVIAGGGGGATFLQTNGGAGGGVRGETGMAAAGGGPATETEGGFAGSGGARGDSASAIRVPGRIGYPELCETEVSTGPPSKPRRSPAESPPNVADRTGGSTSGNAGSGGGGGFANGCGAGGGGGGGYFGGGGGGQNRGSGGGGSSFAPHGSTMAGRGATPGNHGDRRIGGAGAGATADQADGAPGRVIILP